MIFLIKDDFEQLCSILGFYIHKYIVYLTDYTIFTHYEPDYIFEAINILYSLYNNKHR